ANDGFCAEAPFQQRTLIMAQTQFRKRVGLLTSSSIGAQQLPFIVANTKPGTSFTLLRNGTRHVNTASINVDVLGIREDGVQQIDAKTVDRQFLHQTLSVRDTSL